MPLPPIETAVEGAAPVSPQRRYVLALRIHQSIERQIAAVEKVLYALAPGQLDETARRAHSHLHFTHAARYRGAQSAR
jgi:hypothetical protein